MTPKISIDVTVEEREVGTTKKEREEGGWRYACSLERRDRCRDSGDRAD